MEMYFSKGKRSVHLMNELEIKNTSMEDILRIFSSTNFIDSRESYFELCNKGLLECTGINIEFVQDDIFTLIKGVIRGIHSDTKTGNPVLC